MRRRACAALKADARRRVDQVRNQPPSSATTMKQTTEVAESGRWFYDETVPADVRIIRK